MLNPDITHSYYLKDAHAYYHEGHKCLHIITDDGEISLENFPLPVIRKAIKNRCKS